MRLTATGPGGMFLPLTFIVVEAHAHGMSQRLANYLVPILNAARSVVVLVISLAFPPITAVALAVVIAPRPPLSNLLNSPPQHNRPYRSQRPRRQTRPLQHHDPHVLLHHCSHHGHVVTYLHLYLHLHKYPHHRLCYPLRHLVRRWHWPYACSVCTRLAPARNRPAHGNCDGDFGAGGADGVADWGPTGCCWGV